MLKDMKSYNHLKPGQRGTLRLVEQYGDSLLCVRYRFDEKRRVRLKTVEIIVEERPVEPPRYKNEDIVAVQVAFEETTLREQLRKLRAQWDPRLKVWLVSFGSIHGGPLETRILGK